MRRAEWFLAILVFLSAGFVTAEAEHPALQAIDDARASGGISEGEAALYKVMFVTGTEGLPAQFSVGHGVPVRCATQIIENARQNMGDYALDIQSELDKMLSRPGGLPEYIDTDHFRIHYAISGSEMIYGWPNTTYRDGVAISCEESWEEFHNGVNQDWDLVPSDGGMGGGSGLIDCYVKNLGSGLYGYAEAEFSVPGDPPWDYTGFFVIDNDYAEFDYSDRLDPARVTIAHEYHHVIQFGYNVSGGGGYWMEQIATWQEDKVYDGINDNYGYLGCFFPIPYKKLSYTNGCHEYGAFVWPRFLMEYFDIHGIVSPGRDLIEDIWHEIKWAGGSALTRMDDILLLHGSSLDLSFAEFGRWNFYTQARNDGQHYEEGGNYYAVSQDRAYFYYPWYDQHPTVTKRPDRLGTSYMKFNRDTDSDHNTLVVTFDGPSTTNAVTILAKEDGGNIFHEYYMVLDENKNGVLSVEGWDGMDYAYMAVAIQNNSTDAQDYAFDVETQQGSASVGEGADRIVVLAENRPNPFYPATTIRYSLAESAPVTVRVADAGGRIIRTLVHEHQPSGPHEVKWFADDDSGRRLPAGVYFYQIQAGPQTHSKKMILLP
jgi:hypothetical protein